MQLFCWEWKYTENNTEEVKEEATNFLDSLNDQINYKLVVFIQSLKSFYMNLGFWFFFICFVFFIIEEIIFCCSSVHKLLSQ